MRQKADQQLYFKWTGDASLKVVKMFRRKYDKISEILDLNADILDLVHEDLKPLTAGKKKGGRKADFTSEILFRAILVHAIEGTSLRETSIRIAETPFLQEFIRLGTRTPMDYSFLDKAFHAIRPETWMKINKRLGAYAVEEGRMDPSAIRMDTTVVEANIHYPTDAALLWDSWRVLVRLLREAREEMGAHRFHDKKARKLYLWITRYAKSPSAKRKREVRRWFSALIEDVRRVYELARKLCEREKGRCSLDLIGIIGELEFYLPSVAVVMGVAEQVQLRGEMVPASERVFSIFEPHVELIKRGKAGKPVEWGHMVWLAQTREKFITDYGVMEERKPDTELADPIIERHKAIFGNYPEGITADKGFRAKPEKMEDVEKKVETVAIPQRLKDWVDTFLPVWHRFRAGIEGSISVLKRAFRLAICYYRGFKGFSASVGMGIVAHNLVMLADASSD